jgi:hypothetical protein
MEMNKEYDYSYRILGLRPGASPSEIKSAYRRLVKLYHPDRDPSQDSVVMYIEIRAAYDKLFNMDHSSKTGTYTDTRTGTNTGTGASAGTGAGVGTGTGTSTAYSSGSMGSKRASRNFASGHNKNKRNIPFEFMRLPHIFINSLKQMTVSFILFEIAAMLFVCRSTIKEPYAIMAISYHIASWFFFVFFRYYFATSEWPIYKRVMSAVLYGLILLIMITLSYSMQISDTIFATLYAWYIMAHPDESMEWRDLI